jgi:MFS family permease
MTQVLTDTNDRIPAQASGKALAFIYTTLFLDIMGVTLLLPIIPYIVRQYNPDALMVGLLTGIYSAAAFCAAPVLGWFSDRWGRRPVLLLSVFGSAVGYFIFGIGGALWVLFLSRLIDGLTGGNIATAMAYIADVTPPEKRTKYYAFAGMAFGLGFTLGPVIAGALSGISIFAPAFAAGGMALASVIFGFFFLPESLPLEKRSGEAFSLARVNPFRIIKDMARLPNLGVLLISLFVVYLALNGLYSYIAVFTFDRFNASAVDNAVLFTVVGVVQMIVQGGIVYRLAPRFGEKKIAILGLILQAISYPLFVIAAGLPALYPLVILSTIGNAFSRPTLDAMVANSVDAHEQGRAAGASTALYSLASVFGPLLAGLAYTQLSPSSPYIAAGFLLVLAAVLLFRVRLAPRPKPVERPVQAA